MEYLLPITFRRSPLRDSTGEVKKYFSHLEAMTAIIIDALARSSKAQNLTGATVCIKRNVLYKQGLCMQNNIMPYYQYYLICIKSNSSLGSQLQDKEKGGTQDCSNSGNMTSFCRDRSKYENMQVPIGQGQVPRGVKVLDYMSPPLQEDHVQYKCHTLVQYMIKRRCHCIWSCYISNVPWHIPASAIY